MPHLFDALEAYRADLAHGARGEPFSERDTVWLAWASALERASSLTGHARADALRRAFAELSAGMSDDGSRTVHVTEYGEALPQAVASHALVISEEAEKAGAYATATLILDLAQSTLEGDRGVLHGRLMAQQARILGRLGDLDTAEHLYESVEQLGTEIESAELRDRALLGKGIVAQMRGDRLAARAMFQSILDADGGLWDLKQLARSHILDC